MAFEQLSDKLQGIMKKIKGQSRLTEANMEEMLKEIRISLLEADVNYKVVKEFVNNVKEKALGQDVLKTLSPGQMILKIIKEELVKLLGEENDALNISGLTSIMMVGLQGSGKTTTASKIAYLMRKKNNKRPLLVALDVYRPAAIDQLITLGKSIDVEVFYDKESKDVVNIATRALAYAREKGFDLVILDTAGRLQVDEALMDELKNIILSSLNSKNMIDKTILLSKTDRFKFLDFRNAIEKRRVIFESIEAYYLAQELYNFI